MLVTTQLQHELIRDVHKGNVSSSWGRNKTHLAAGTFLFQHGAHSEFLTCGHVHGVGVVTAMYHKRRIKSNCGSCVPIRMVYLKTPCRGAMSLLLMPETEDRSLLINLGTD